MLASNDVFTNIHDVHRVTVVCPTLKVKSLRRWIWIHECCMQSTCIQCLFIETKRDMIYVRTYRECVYTHYDISFNSCFQMEQPSCSDWLETAKGCPFPTLTEEILNWLGCLNTCYFTACQGVFWQRLRLCATIRCRIEGCVRILGVLRASCSRVLVRRLAEFFACTPLRFLLNVSWFFVQEWSRSGDAVYRFIRTDDTASKVN